VEALQARSGSLPLEERVNGVVQARNQVAVRPEISAPVVAVMVRSGEEVRRGQPLVRLDDETVRQQLRRAEAGLRLARAEATRAAAQVEELRTQVVRNRELARQELISAVELDTQEAQLAAVEAGAEEAAARVEEARATVEERQAAQARTVVRSPVNGRVGRRQVEVGQLVNPSTLLFQVGDPQDLMVEIPLTERMLGYVQEGQTVVLTPPGKGEAKGEAKGVEDPLRATLSRISPFLEEGSFSTVGEIDLPPSAAERLRPGMFVRVDVLYGESERATLVPASALWDDPRTGLEGIFVVRDLPADLGAELTEEAYAVELRPVTVLAEGRSLLGVEGVEPEEWVVTVGQHLLASGEAATARVRPIPWERMLALQGLQREDLLRGFLDKQQQLARTLGADLPPNEEFFQSAPSTPHAAGESP
jgi:RND family efflux transporter MFP subunit